MDAEVLKKLQVLTHNGAPQPEPKPVQVEPGDAGAPDLTPITIGEVFENPVTGERSVILERPWDNPEGRLTSEMTALVGSRMVGEHYHPALVERFTVLEGELTVKCGGQTSMLRQGESAVIQAGVWHDWWNAADRNARVRVEVTPGERLGHLLETFFGLARLGHTDSKGMPHVLQLALTGREFSDVIVFRSPPPAVQRLIFGALAPIARLARLSCDVPAALPHRARASST